MTKWLGYSQFHPSPTSQKQLLNLNLSKILFIENNSRKPSLNQIIYILNKMNKTMENTQRSFDNPCSGNEAVLRLFSDLLKKFLFCFFCFFVFCFFHLQEYFQLIKFE